MRPWLALAAILVFAPALSATDDDVHTIIQRSVAANQADWKAAPSYDFSEREKDHRGQTKTFREIMIQGSRYEQLIAINNEPLSAGQKQEEDRKLEEVRADRKSESHSERAARLARYEKSRKRDRLLMDQLTEAFDFTLIGEDDLNSHHVYVLQARPRPGYKPPNMEAQVLAGMEGKLWIDKATFQWVKVEAEVIHPVTISGFLARVEPGTRFELEKEPVSDSVWLPSHFSMRSRAKVLMLFAHNGQDDETYFDYQKNSTAASSSGN
jgi:hypothetical protein